MKVADLCKSGLPDGAAFWKVRRKTGGRPALVLGADRRPLAVAIDIDQDDLAELVGPGHYRLQALAGDGKRLPTEVDVVIEAEAGAAEADEAEAHGHAAPPADWRSLLEANVQMARSATVTAPWRKRRPTGSRGSPRRGSSRARSARSPWPIPPPPRRDKDEDGEDDDEAPPPPNNVKVFVDTFLEGIGGPQALVPMVTMAIGLIKNALASKTPPRPGGAGQGAQGITASLAVAVAGRIVVLALIKGSKASRCQSCAVARRAWLLARE
jgi:hypothetical protein